MLGSWAAQRFETAGLQGAIELELLLANAATTHALLSDHLQVGAAAVCDSSVFFVRGIMHRP
eukprot:SAG11_NODE_12039_length_725_cov_0.731629_1_plen_61_part_10